MSVLKFIKNEFLFNGHLQSTGAAGVFYICAKLLFDLHPPFVLVFSTYLLFEAIFIFDRYYDLDWDALTNTDRAKHLSLYRNKIPYIFSFLVLSSLILFYVFTNTVVLVFMSTVLVLGILYPIYFKKLTRYIPLFKNIYVSGVYVILPVLPRLYLGYSSREVILAFHMPVVIFVESLIAQIILDTKDTEADGRVHLKTLSVIVGNKSALVVALFLSVCLAIVSSAISIFTKAPHLFLMLTVFALFIDGYILFLLKHKNKNGYLLAAAKFSIWFVVFFVAQLFL